MRILHGMPRFGSVSETFIADLLHGLIDRGNEVTVVCNNTRGEWFDHERLAVVKAYYTRPSIVDRMTAMLRSGLGKDRARFVDFELKQRRGRRVLEPLLSKSRYDVAYFDFGKSAVVFAPLLVERSLPFVVHFHGVDITRGLSDGAYRRALPFVFEHAQALVVASDHIRRLLVLEGAPEEKIRLVRLGFDLEGTTPLAWEERRRRGPGIAYLGRMAPKKNPVALVEAFRIVAGEIPDARLTMIGDGEELKRVRERVERYALSGRVDLLGRRVRKEALSIVNQHWVYAQHSVTSREGDQEGFGVSLAEAAALGLPVVSTLHNGIPEQVIDGTTGYLVREHDYETMAERLIALLKDPVSCESMGNAGRENIYSICSTERRITEIESLLRAVSR